LGPVGSIGSPESEAGFEKCSGDGFTLFIHREIFSTAAVPGEIQFHFGAYGWMSVRLEEQVEEG
jgi:hypothetical protein